MAVWRPDAHFGEFARAIRLKAPGNTSTTRRRRAYIIRWTGDRAVYNPRPNIQPMLYDPPIAKGGPLDCDLFPVVRRSA